MIQDNGIIWRPLLRSSRSMILEYLKAKGIKYVVDSTNLKSDYRRNYLRNEIIPLLKKEWKGFDKAVLSSIEYIGEENRLVEKNISDTLPSDGNALNTKIILNFSAPVLLIRRFIESAGPFTTTAEEILSAVKAAKPHARIWHLKKADVILKGGNLYLNKPSG